MPIPVQVRTMDDVVQEQGLQRLDFIKIGTEGNEWKVLSGASKSLGQHRPYVLFEYDESFWDRAGCHAADAQEFLDELGYRIYIVHEKCLTKVRPSWPHSANLLTVPAMLNH